MEDQRRFRYRIELENAAGGVQAVSLEGTPAEVKRKVQRHMEKTGGKAKSVAIVGASETLLASTKAVSVDSSSVVNWLSEGDEPPPPKAPEDAAPEFKRCPYCAEVIQGAAVKCRFCGEVVCVVPSTVLPTHLPRQTRAAKNPGLAAALSFLLPGLGQIYNGQVGPGILLGIICIALYSTIILGLVMHAYLIHDAYRQASRFNAGLPLT